MPASSLQLPQPTFATARSLLGLTSGIAPIDSLLGGLKPDTVALITGSDIRLRIAESYCVRAQLPPARGGIDGSAFFIDGGNSFDVYLFTELARRHKLPYSRALERQLLSRAFTIYELRSLIQDSASVFATRGPKLLVVSEVFSLFNDDVDKEEAQRVVQEMANSVSEVSKREQVPVLMTSASRPRLLAPILEERCNVSAEITVDDRRFRSRLFKHAWKAPTETLAEVRPGSYNQATLEAEPNG